MTATDTATNTNADEGDPEYFTTALCLVEGDNWFLEAIAIMLYAQIGFWGLCVCVFMMPCHLCSRREKMRLEEIAEEY